MERRFELRRAAGKPTAFDVFPLEVSGLSLPWFVHALERSP